MWDAYTQDLTAIMTYNWPLCSPANPRIWKFVSSEKWKRQSLDSFYLVEPTHVALNYPPSKTWRKLDLSLVSVENEW